MMLLSMKTYPAFLRGVCVLFAVECLTASTPETSSIHFTTEPDKTTGGPTTAHVLHSEEESQPATLKPAEVSVAATVENKVLPTVENENTFSSNGSTLGSAVLSSAAATTSNMGFLHASTAVTATAREPEPSNSTTITAEHTDDQLHQQSHTTSPGTTAPATTAAAFTATVSVSSPRSTTIPKPEVTSELSSTTSSDESTQVPIFIQTLNTSTITASPTTETAPVFVSTSVTTPETRSKTSTERSSSSPSSPAASISTSQFPGSISPSTNTSTSSPSSPAASISTSQFPGSTSPSTNTSTSSPSSPAASISTSQFPGSTSPSTNTSTDSPSSTTDMSTSPAGILVPRHPETAPTNKSLPAATTTPCEASAKPPGTEVQPCSSRGVVKHCLIVIASLAVLATVFMVSTIILCTKLAGRKYKVTKARKPQSSTEMMCISALLPESTYTYSRQRNPVTNGVLVIPAGGDSDEDGGDNLTLSSFLPDNDRYV